MKLLGKEEIAQHKSFEKKQEIDEAVKLAKKVDRLRELASKEQSNLLKFRDESIKDIKAEIESRNAQKYALSDEIKALEEKRKELLKPLDEEWIKVKTQKEHIDKLKESLYQQEVLLKQKEEKRDKELDEIKREKEIIANTKISIIRNLKKSESTSKQTDIIYKKMLVKSEKADKDIASKLKEVREFETNLKFKEVDLNNLKIYLDKRDEQLRKEAILLADREQILLRNIKRLNKTYGNTTSI